MSQIRIADLAGKQLPEFAYEYVDGTQWETIRFRSPTQGPSMKYFCAYSSTTLHETVTWGISIVQPIGANHIKFPQAS